MTVHQGTTIREDTLCLMLQSFDRWSRCYGRGWEILALLYRFALRALWTESVKAAVAILMRCNYMNSRDHSTWKCEPLTAWILERRVKRHSEERSCPDLWIVSKLVSLRDARVGSTVRGCLSLVLESAEDDDTTAAATTWLAVILLQ